LRRVGESGAISRESHFVDVKINMTFRRKSLTTHHMFNQVFNLLLLLPFLSYCSFASARKDDGIDRIFSSEELSGYVGKDGGQIYLSVLGEVYDVTEGKGTYVQKK